MSVERSVPVFKAGIAIWSLAIFKNGSFLRSIQLVG